MKFVLIAGHQVHAPRKVGFHFWADYLAARGDKVYFVTAGNSRLSLLSRKSSLLKPYNRWIEVKHNLYSLTWVPPFHPCLNRPALNKLLLPFFSLYPKFFPRTVLSDLQNTDVIVVESGPGLTLIPLLARKCPNAKIIYEVSDRLATVGAHPVILKAEKEALQHCDLVRVPAAVMVNDFATDAPVWYTPQGLNKSDFDAEFTNPYRNPKNVVSIGDMLFDAAAIEIMANAFPDWTFHLFGRNAKLSNTLPNVTEYGEIPIAQLTPYIQYADIGLAPYRTAPNCEYLAQSSLKMIQYTYCQLPIVAPNFAGYGRPHVSSYESNECPDEIVAAFRSASLYNKTKIRKADVLAWEEMFERMLLKVNESSLSHNIS